MVLSSDLKEDNDFVNPSSSDRWVQSLGDSKGIISSSLKSTHRNSQQFFVWEPQVAPLGAWPWSEIDKIVKWILKQIDYMCCEAKS